MVYPFDNSNCRDWEPYIAEPGSYTRPLAGAEQSLDSVQFLNDGHSTIIGGVLISTRHTAYELQSRILEAFLRLRFYSPLISARIVRDLHFKDCGSWVYKPASYQEARRWAIECFKVHTYADGELSTRAAVDQFIQEQLLNKLPIATSAGESWFHVHLLSEHSSGRAALLLHVSHTILDGRALIDALELLLGYTVQPNCSSASTELEWGKEWKNLVPNPLTLFGPPKDGWGEDGLASLKELDEVVTAAKPPNGWKPQHKVSQVAGFTHRVVRTLSPELSSTLVKRVKEMGSSVTVALEAAQILAIRDLSDERDDTIWHSSSSSLLPALVSVRHLMQPPWNKRSTLTATISRIALYIPNSFISVALSPAQAMPMVMQSFKAQYSRWLSDSHYVHLGPAQTALQPFRSRLTVPNAEITNLGVIDRKMHTNWESEGDTTLKVEDFYLGLRRIGPVLTTHVFTLHGQVRVQCQGSDLWDMSFMEAFLDEIIKNVESLAYS